MYINFFKNFYLFYTKKGSVMTLYYKDADAAILVFDVKDKKSMDDLNYWITELENQVEIEGMIIILVGNKIDVPDNER